MLRPREQATRILLIEDNPGDARLIREVLAEFGGEAFILEIADRLSAGLERLAQGGIELVLLGLGLPDSTGLGTLERVLAQATEAPVIVLTGLNDEAVGLIAVRAGAQDYLVKGRVAGQLLGRAVRYAIERYRTESELLRSESQFRTMVETAEEGIWTLDADGKTTYANDRMTQMLGYAEQEMLGRSASHLLDEPLGAEWERRFELIRQGTKQRFDFRFRHKDGSTLWALVSCSPLMGPRDNFTGGLFTITDISERKRAEEYLEAAAQEWRTTFDSIPDPVSIHDRDLRLVRMNRAFARTFGTEPKELVGKTCYEVVHGTKEPWPQCPHRQTLETGQLACEEFFEPCLGRYLECSTSPHVQNGEIIGTVLLIKDITERKKVEQQVQESLENLERVLQETVKAMALTVEMRDPYTAGHERRVAQLACAIAEEMVLGEEQVGYIRTASLLHDIGKMGIPMEILIKPGKINEFERGLIRTHSRIGSDILKEIHFSGPVAQVVVQHHERLDGSGYPSGISGKDILLGARILAVADLVEAMVSNRPYRPALGLDQALDEISRNRGILYDPEVVDACLKLFLEKGFEFEHV